jgi:DNA polymerase-4
VPARIACLDLDTFFVSVERLLNPALIGRPVVVGGERGSRGVVTSASYEVRALGVRSGMPMAEAVRLAPDAVFVPTRHDTYAPHARRVREVLERHCPVVQTASIDEFFLDFHGTDRLYGRPGEDGDATTLRVVREMRAAVQAETGLPASVGVGTTRAIAKMGSGRAKPAGVFMVPAGQERAFVDGLPVRKFPGIGPVAEARLVEAGLATLGQLLASAHPLAERVREGISGTRPLGPDRPAFQEHDREGDTAGSLSNERTFMADVGRPEMAEEALRGLAERVAWRARQRAVRARTVSLKLRYADFETLTRARSGPPTSDEAHIFAVAKALLHEAWSRRARVRLLGLQLANLEGPDRQLLLPFVAGRPTAARAIDAVRERFGYDAIRLGVARRPT